MVFKALYFWSPDVIVSLEIFSKVTRTHRTAVFSAANGKAHYVITYIFILKSSFKHLFITPSNTCIGEVIILGKIFLEVPLFLVSFQMISVRTSYVRHSFTYQARKDSNLLLIEEILRSNIEEFRSPFIPLRAGFLEP